MNKIDKVLEDLKLDAILLSDEANMRYFTGFCGEGMIVYTKGKYFVVTDSRYTVSSEQETRGHNCEIITMKDYDIYTELAKIAEDNNIKSIGFEAMYIVFSDYDLIKKALKNVEKFVPINEELDDIRRVKEKEELELIRQAETIGDKAFSHVLTVIKTGMTELEVAAQIELALKVNGAEKLSFDTIVASGINGDKPHAVPSEKKIAKGEFVTMDFGCKYHGYCSDMTRTVAMGEISDKQRLVYETVKAAQEAAFSAINEKTPQGYVGKDIDKAARDLIESHGFGDYFGHGLGHSLGLKIHENPRFSKKDNTRIVPDMLLTVEPGIYIPGEMGVRIEDLLVTTKTGFERLSHSERELIRIDR